LRTVIDKSDTDPNAPAHTNSNATTYTDTYTYTTDRDATTNGRSLRHAGNDPNLWKHLNAPARGNG
jgi:hypothetical protein